MNKKGEFFRALGTFENVIELIDYIRNTPLITEIHARLQPQDLQSYRKYVARTINKQSHTSREHNAPSEHGLKHERRTTDRVVFVSLESDSHPNAERQMWVTLREYINLKTTLEQDIRGRLIRFSEIDHIDFDLGSGKNTRVDFQVTTPVTIKVGVLSKNPDVFKISHHEKRVLQDTIQKNVYMDNEIAGREHVWIVVTVEQRASSRTPYYLLHASLVLPHETFDLDSSGSTIDIATEYISDKLERAISGYIHHYL